MIDHIMSTVNQTEMLGNPNESTFDPYANMRLRVGVIDNPTLTRTPNKFDPVDPSYVVNMVTGKVCIRWIDYTGGIVGKPGPFEQGKYGNINNNQQSEVEMVHLTHPLIWSGVDANGNARWCGTNYLPPIGSVVIVGFRKTGLPLLLGYVQANFSDCKPIELGETMIKGYGNNWTYWEQDHRWETRAWVNEGEPLNTRQATPVATKGVTLKVIIDALTEQVILIGEDTDGNGSSVVLQPNSIISSSKDKQGHGAHVAVTPTSIINQAIFGHDYSSIIVSAGDLTIDTTGTLNLRAHQQVNVVSEGTFNTYSASATTVKGSTINLN